MTLKPGTKLGPYEIHSLIGKGGMGEVYKARDSRLNRTVAIKVLPPHFSDNVEMKQRFEREARTISSLNHPNICVLHDIGQQDGIDYLVMEFLEGQTLAERLQKGAMRLNDALKIATEIADALDKAHLQGIVHRDLKPANVMQTKNGAKLLDFGLAKTRVASGPSAATTLPADTNVTAHGQILGTLQYMSPEQLEGQDADARTDIFAFGTILYEMVTGKKTFEGKSQASLIGAILERQPPPVSSLNPVSPPALDNLIRRCLAKHPDERWQSARDVLFELKWASEASNSAAEILIPSKPEPRFRISTVVLAVVALAALIPAALYFRSLRSTPPPEPATQFDIPVVGMNSAFTMAISPDGRRVAYVARSQGKDMIWVRPLNSLDAHMLPGTEGAFVPDWSADSNSIVFYSSDGKLKRVDISGGPVQILTEIKSNYRRATSNTDGVIVFGADPVLRRVSAAGGEAVDVTELDKSLEETFHSAPWFLPDGKHFLYTAWSSKPQNRAIYLGSLDSKSRKRLMPAESKALYSPPGFILYLRQRALMARPFDASKLEFTGDATVIAENIAYVENLGTASFYASNEGTVIYRKADSVQAATRQLSWMDRTGKSSGPISGAFTTTDLKLSPDGKRVAFSESNNGANWDVWIYDTERDVRTRLTSDAADDYNPVWSPDGARVAFVSERSNPNPAARIYEKLSSGAVPEQLLLGNEQGLPTNTSDWSADGRVILFEKWLPFSTPTQSGNQADIWVLPVDGDRKPFPYLATDFNERQPALSPNGRWLAYVSNETGSAQVVVQPFPDPSGGKWQISTKGGVSPRWRHDGRELYYRAPNREMVAVSVTADSSFKVGKSQTLFTVPQQFAYDVAPDGQRFLVSQALPQAPSPTSTSITVILNWPSLLSKK